SEQHRVTRLVVQKREQCEESRDHQGRAGDKWIQGHEPELRSVGALGRRGRGAVVGGFGGLGGLRGSAHGRTLRSGPRRGPEPWYSYPASALTRGMCSCRDRVRQEMSSTSSSASPGSASAEKHDEVGKSVDDSTDTDSVPVMAGAE